MDSFFDIFASQNDANFCYIFEEKNVNKNGINLYKNNAPKNTFSHGGVRCVFFKKNEKNFTYKLIRNNSSNYEKILYKECRFKSNRNKLKKLIYELNLSNKIYEKIDSLEIVYGYSNRIKNFIILYGKKINLQIVFSSDGVVAGSPIIYNGY